SAGDVKDQFRFAGHRFDACRPVAAAGHADEERCAAAIRQQLDVQTLERWAGWPRIGWRAFDRFQERRCLTGGIDDGEDVRIPIVAPAEPSAERAAIGSARVQRFFMHSNSPDARSYDEAALPGG